MKTKLFLSMCLVTGLALTQVPAQNTRNDNGNKSIAEWVINPAYMLPVYCDGELVDELWCSPVSHGIMHFENGIPMWLTAMNMGEAVSLWTDENFKIKDLDKITFTDEGGTSGTVFCHVNLIGDQGSHYIGTYEYDYPSWTVTSVIRAVCPCKKGK